MRVQDLADHRQQVIERHQQSLAQRHRDGLLRRRQGRLQPMQRVAAILDTVALASFADRLQRHPEAFGKHRPRVIAGLDRRAHPGCRRRLAVKMDQHVNAPSRRTPSEPISP